MPTASGRACCLRGFHCRILQLPDHEFLFALEMADDPGSSRMLGELCAAVLGHVGYAAPAIAEVNRELHEAIVRGAPAGRCDVRFVAQHGELHIVVARVGAAEWRTSRRLPTP
jgi:hypothetical protein